MPSQEIKLAVSGNLPGEQLVASVFSYAQTVRSTMSQENRDAWDARLLQIYDDWRGFWVGLGVLK
jgi:hypothetical protein